MKLTIRNFRSVKDQEIDLAPITVVYGPNGAGKSSLLYALLTLKNLVLNPNQTSSGFFNYVFASLGNFDAVVFDHQIRSSIELGIALEKDGLAVSYQASIKENEGEISLRFEGEGQLPGKLQLPVTFPYPANQQTQLIISGHQKSFTVTWNGIVVQVQAGTQVPVPDFQGEAGQLAASLNAPAELLRRVSFVPLKRGFSKPHYSSVPVSPLMISEDEVATFISANKYLVSKVSLYLERILGRDFRVNSTPGTAIFSLDATDKRTGVSSELVNEGFGINQIVYFLARCLQHDAEWVCVEEPEIHLHPTAIRELARALVQIVREEGKRFIISTHSEAFVLALLTLVAEGELKPSELACYLAQKERKTTQFERQAVNEKGQIEGGLKNFIEGELEDLKAFMEVPD